jgi:hypothetical protein
MLISKNAKLLAFILLSREIHKKTIYVQNFSLVLGSQMEKNYVLFVLQLIPDIYDLHIEQKTSEKYINYK